MIGVFSVGILLFNEKFLKIGAVQALPRMNEIRISGVEAGVAKFNRILTYS